MAATRKSKSPRSHDSVSFDISSADRAIVLRIVERADELATVKNKMALMMDLIACHANGNPLRFSELLAADDFNFAHDVFGIGRHVCRDTGHLLNFFRPRFSASVTEGAA